MIDVTISSNIDIIARKYGARRAAVFREVSAAVAMLTGQLKARVVERLSGETLNVKSGRLVASIQSDVETGFDVVIGRVWSSGVPYARVHEYGGKGYYTILPTKARALAFYAKSGDWVVTKRVNHPPAAKRSFMRASLTDLTPLINRELKAAIQRAIRQ